MSNYDSNQQEVLYIDHMGSDLSVVRAARVSMAQDDINFTDKQNKSLINYLSRGQSESDYNKDVLNLLEPDNTTKEVVEILAKYKHITTHWTPFAHTSITLRMKAPVPIRTQCFKHKQGFVENEESRRYISTKPELFIPEHFRSKADNVKQGSKGKHFDSEYWLTDYVSQCKRAITMYESMLEDGVAPEQARFILPQGCMVNWYWTGNLYAFANFYNSRSDSHAQAEIRDLAEMVKSVIQPLYPISWQALTGKITNTGNINDNKITNRDSH